MSRRATMKLRSWGVSAALAKQDIFDRFARTVLGPFWIVISNAALVLGITVVFGALFQTDIKTYVVYVALGIAIWTFMSAVITQASKYLESGKALLFTFDLPWMVQIARSVFVEAIVLFIHLLVALPVILLTQDDMGLVTLVSFLGIALILAFGFSMGLLISAYGARYSDLSYALDSVMLFLFLFTPVFWTAESLGETRRGFAEYNPLYHFLETVRGPILDQAVPWTSFAVAGGSTLLLFTVGYFIFKRRSREFALWIQ